MMLLRTMQQVKTSRMIPGFRACATLSRLDRSLGDRARRVGAMSALFTAESRRLWLARQQRSM